MKYHVSIILFIAQLLVAAPDSTKSYSSIVENLEKHDGFITFYWDNKNGTILFELEKLDDEFLYVNSLPRGIGSNDIGIDRGQLNGERIIKFDRQGNKVLIIQPNYKFRAITDNQSEKNAVEQSFAYSVLAGLNIIADEEGKLLVDATPFLLSDINNIPEILSRMDQGQYGLDNSKSAFYTDNIKNFPDNSEIETILTFTGSQPGNYLRQVVPSPNNITIHQRHSFIKLPDDNFQPRKFDPRAGYYGIEYYDFASPIDQPVVKRLIARHRLKKKNPDQKLSEPVKPIIYYVDNGVPEDIRSALIEGAGWWNKAFESAGYKNAFQVKILPEGADPMDIRFNLVQWVHRSTRGWSYGSSVTDPRTGEIIKGHVSLGSLRVRQDLMIAQGLLSPFVKGDESTEELQQMALARIKQLSAHEVGHTLGISHNFSASSFGRASVMDYPHPLLRLDENGKVDLSDAYDNKIGRWDEIAVQYGYSEFDGEEETGLNNIINKCINEGMIFISDYDARLQSGSHPTAHLWDNGNDAIEELKNIIEVRNIALQNISERTIRTGEPYSNIEDVLVPVYLLHRYQVEAVSKMVGGTYYTYALRGDEQTVLETINPETQANAMKILTETLKPQFLALPESVINIIPPKAFGYSRNRENFNSKTSPNFDPVTAAETSANITLDLIFNPARASRIAEQNAFNKNIPSLENICRELIELTWHVNYDNPYYKLINETVSILLLHKMFALALDERAVVRVRSAILSLIDELEIRLKSEVNSVDKLNLKSHYSFALDEIRKFKQFPDNFELYSGPQAPEGSPIGFCN